MPIHKLSKAGIRKIESVVTDLFQKTKARVLGSAKDQKGLFITVGREGTLAGLFEAAVKEEGVGTPDTSGLNSVLNVAESYLDAAQERAKAQVVQAVQAALHESSMNNGSVDVRTVLTEKLNEVMDTTQTTVHAIVDTEASNARNVGVLEGISKVNAIQGVEDPIVFFVVVNDDRTCSECRRIHLQPDGITPRVWKLSEIKAGYHKKGDDFPSLGGLHPHCRCTLTTLLPGFGFNKGRVSYLGKKHDELEKQRQGT